MVSISGVRGYVGFVRLNQTKSNSTINCSFYSFGAQVIALKWTPIMIIVITSMALLWASLALTDDFIV